MQMISAVLAATASVIGAAGLPLDFAGWGCKRSTRWKPPRKPTGTHKQNRRKVAKGRAR